MKILRIISIVAFEYLLLIASVSASEAIKTSDKLKNQIDQTAQEWTELELPKAHKWNSGMKIHSKNDQKVLYFVHSNEEEAIKSAKEGLTPRRTLMLSVASLDKDSGTYTPGQVVAIVKNSSTSFRDQFSVYTISDSDLAKDVLKTNDRINFESYTFYKIGKISASIPFGHKYQRYKKDGSKYTMLKSDNMLTCISELLCCMPFLFAKWHFNFVNPRTKIKTIIRNQQAQVTTVAPNQNILEAICISYAIDCLTNPCDSEFLRENLMKVLTEEPPIKIRAHHHAGVPVSS